MTDATTRIPSEAAALSTRAALPWLILPACVGTLAVLRHEWWRDEAYTWLVANASPTLPELVANIRSTGHPWTYYVFSWAIHQVWQDPIAMSLVNLAIALAAIALVFRSAPVSKVQAALFSVGFFPLYQYGVFARSYSLLMLLIFAFCHLRSVRPDSIASRLLLLAVLAHVHLWGAVIAAALLFYDFLSSLQTQSRWLIREWLGAAIVVVSGCVALWEMMQRGGQPTSFGARELLPILRGFANAFVPPYRFTDDWPTLQLFFGLVLWLGSFALLWLRRASLTAYMLVSAALMTAHVVAYAGVRYHHGFYFIGFMAAIWLGGRAQLQGLRSHLLTALLGLHALIGVYALQKDIVLPYSDGPLAAQYLKANRLDRLPLVGMSGRPLSDSSFGYRFEVDLIQPVIVHINEGKVYNYYEERFIHFADYTAELSHRRIGLDSAERALTAMKARLGAPFVVVAMTTPRFPIPSPLQKLVDLPESLDFGERYTLFLYPADRPPPQ